MQSCYKFTACCVINLLLISVISLALSAVDASLFHIILTHGIIHDVNGIKNISSQESFRVWLHRKRGKKRLQLSRKLSAHVIRLARWKCKQILAHMARCSQRWKRRQGRFNENAIKALIKYFGKSSKYIFQPSEGGWTRRNWNMLRHNIKHPISTTIYQLCCVVSNVHVSLFWLSLMENN